jgi:hypothetical protein
MFIEQYYFGTRIAKLTAWNIIHFEGLILSQFSEYCGTLRSYTEFLIDRHLSLT